MRTILDEIIKHRYELASKILDDIIPVIFTISINLANANSEEAVGEVIDEINSLPAAFFEILDY